MGGRRVRQKTPRLCLDPKRATRACQASRRLAAVLGGNRRSSRIAAGSWGNRVTAEYLDSLAEALSFDRSLARRVRSEFEDHLEEAIAYDQCEDRVEAERRAIAKCGDPHAIAAELAVTSLARRSKMLAAGIVIVLVSVLLAMKGHVAWYAAMQWGIPDNVQAVATPLGKIARCSFGVAMLLGVTSCIYA